MLVLSALGSTLYWAAGCRSDLQLKTPDPYLSGWEGAPTVWYLGFYLWPKHYIPKGEWDLVIVQAGLLAVLFHPDAGDPERGVVPRQEPLAGVRDDLAALTRARAPSTS